MPDPEGLIGPPGGETEVDGVTDGSELWLIEAKHVRYAVTEAVVARFLVKRILVERALGRNVDRMWIASDAGFRTGARERCEQAGVLMSGARQLTQLERALAG